MLKILNSGFFTTIQDDGRFNYRHKGVPVSGAMDRYSAGIANSLLENDTNAAVMEITMTGPTIAFEKPTFIAITGAELSPRINDVDVKSYEVQQISKGDILSFGKLKNGFRAYLAIKNGFQTEIKLGSRSFYSPITSKRCLRDLMEIAYSEVAEFTPKIPQVKAAPIHKEMILKATRGPEYGMLSQEQLEELFATTFSIAKENNRMAYQLNEPIASHEKSMLTSATLPGTVQLTPSGRLILLMKDGQTTGGYPRILQLTNRSINILAQKKSGDQLTFAMD